MQEIAQQRKQHFYPRSPCGERPLSALAPEENTTHFYPRSPCGERPMQVVVVVVGTIISIHALLAESDNQPVTMHTWRKIFLSTLSLRRATRRKTADMRQRLIFLSTLSLRRATP